MTLGKKGIIENQESNLLLHQIQGNPPKTSSKTQLRSLMVMIIKDSFRIKQPKFIGQNLFFLP